MSITGIGPIISSAMVAAIGTRAGQQAGPYRLERSGSAFEVRKMDEAANQSA
jgi:hypothetical protein